MFAEAVALIGGGRHIDPAQTAACADLMKEFLRREAQWAEKLGLTDELPFADLSVVVSDVDYTEQYLDAINAFTCSSAESRCCVAMLNWYGWREAAPTAPGTPGLPDPYLPLLHFFRQGGTFTREHRVFIDVNGQQMIQAESVQKGDLGTAFVSLDA